MCGRFMIKPKFGFDMRTLCSLRGDDDTTEHVFKCKEMNHPILSIIKIDGLQSGKIRKIKDKDHKVIKIWKKRGKKTLKPYVRYISQSRILSDKESWQGISDVRKDSGFNFQKLYSKQFKFQ